MIRHARHMRLHTHLFWREKGGGGQDPVVVDPSKDPLTKL